MAKFDPRFAACLAENDIRPRRSARVRPSSSEDVVNTERRFERKFSKQNNRTFGYYVIKIHINLTNNKNTYSDKHWKQPSDFQTFVLQKLLSSNPRAALSILTPRRVATRRATSLRDGNAREKMRGKPLDGIRAFYRVGDEVRIVDRVVTLCPSGISQSSRPLRVD